MSKGQEIEQFVKMPIEHYNGMMNKLQELIDYQEKEKESADPVYMKKSEVAKVLKITQRTLEAWEKEDKLTPLRDESGKTLRYLKEDVYSFLK